MDSSFKTTAITTPIHYYTLLIVIVKKIHVYIIDWVINIWKTKKKFVQHSILLEKRNVLNKYNEYHKPV